MFSFLSLPKLVAVLCATSLSRATYTIDDTNSTIQYIPGGVQLASAVPPPQWHVAQAPEVNITASFNQTSTVGECNASQNCHMRIPFEGSGITIYVVQVNFAAINVSITVDSLSPTIRTFPEPQFYQHNFSLFQILELPTGSHIIDIALLDSQYGSGDKYAYTNGTSALVFDYAVVDQDDITVPNPSQPGTQKNSVPIGAIVGGVVGGLALVTAILFITFCRHRVMLGALRRRRTEIDPEPKNRRTTLHDRPMSPATTFNPQALYQTTSRNSLTQAPYAQSTYTAPGDVSEANMYPHSISGSNTSRDRYGPTSLSAATELAYARFSGRSSTSGASDDRERPGVPGHGTSAALGLRSGGTPAAARSSTTPSSTRALSDIPALNAARASQLTPDQLDFVHNLISLNVPAADIAGVMERMRVEGEEGEANRRMGLGVERGVLGRGDTKVSELPAEPLPDYEPPSR